MYNLLVSADTESWEGEPYTIELNRYLEYTDTEIQNNFNELTQVQINEIIRFPCIFAYETSCQKDPYFGLIQEITIRQKTIRIRYEIIPIPKFLTSELLSEMLFELDITKWELNRTHWAIKKVDLPRELYAKNILLPEWANREKKAVDINKHIFEVALSFPGEIREYIEPIVAELERTVGPNSYFYDNNYKAQLARPSLDLLLQTIYKDRAKLIVVFLCEKYQEKKWCGIEFNAIREIIFDKRHDKIMYIKMDEGIVEGTFKTDGYIDGRKHNPKEIADFIKTRIELLTLN
jgi:hypothetical protein